MSTEQFLSAVSAKKSGSGWMARCPAHEDRSPSLSIGIGSEGKILLHCHAGCATADVLAKLGFELRDLFGHDMRGGVKQSRAVHRTLSEAVHSLEPKWKHVRTFSYESSTGDLVAHVVRLENKAGAKSFRPVSPTEAGWTLADPNGLWPLYRLCDLIDSDTVCLFEGEGCAEMARELGLVATTSAHGAKSAHKTDWTPLAGKRVVSFPDNDGSGHEYAAVDAPQILRALVPSARVKIVNLPGLAKGEDIVDFVRRLRADRESDEHIRTRIQALVDAAPELSPIVPPSRPDTNAWPAPPDPAVYSGLAGDFARVVEPHSEADPIALLVQLLVAFGNVIGRMAHMRVEDALHFCNLYLVLVGKTSKARKGTSLSRVRHVFRAADEVWDCERVVKGLSSGEGLIHHVRNPQDSDAEEADAGVSDKRALVIEAEFARVLRMTHREGNVLSTVLRDAWDTGDLRSMTKTPIHAKDAHVSIIGHITRDELTRELDRTEAANGFGNRFLWFCARRSKCLPEGSSVPAADLDPILVRLREAVTFAKEQGELVRDEAARRLWREEYPRLSEGHPGLFGAMTARAEAQVLRLSMLYALLDRSAVIRVDHLRAALALWDYAERSAKYIFGDALGDPVADDILTGLRGSEEGLSRSQIRDLFRRHKGAGQVEGGLRRLEDDGLARCEMRPTGGRPEERWFATATKATEVGSNPAELWSLSSLPVHTGASPAPGNRDGGITQAAASPRTTTQSEMEPGWVDPGDVTHGG